MDIAAHAQALSDIAFNPLNPRDLLLAFGTFALVGVWFVIFAETGLMVGFFFPGDSLLFLAGVAASPVANEIVGIRVSLAGLVIGTPVCAIAGAQLGHYLGAKYGPRLFDKPDSRLFRREYVEKAEHYFEKFGPAKAVILARFIPIVRTFLNPVAGVLGMPARRFLLWNVVGGLLWTEGVVLAGWALARQITKVMKPEQIDKYLLPVVVLIVLVSAIPIYIEVYRGWRARRRGNHDRTDDKPVSVSADNTD